MISALVDTARWESRCGVSCLVVYADTDPASRLPVGALQ